MPSHIATPTTCARSSNLSKILKTRCCQKLIGFTLLYFKMAVTPIVPETKMADVGKLISLRNLLVRKVTWLVLTTTSATLILSRYFGGDCMTRITNIYSRLSRTHSFHFDSQRQHTLLHCDLQKQLTLSILTSRDSTLSLTLDFLHSNPRNVFSLQLFSSLFYLYG